MSASHGIRASIVIMGVSGVGKSTVAALLSGRTGLPYVDADDLHGEANVAKMSAGIPLTDEDRWPWLDAIGQWLDERGRAGENAVLTCSALRRIYRDRLRSGRPGLRFIHVDAPEEILRERLEKRQGHYMPACCCPARRGRPPRARTVSVRRPFIRRRAVA